MRERDVHTEAERCATTGADELSAAFRASISAASIRRFPSLVSEAMHCDNTPHFHDITRRKSPQISVAAKSVTGSGLGCGV